MRAVSPLYRKETSERIMFNERNSHSYESPLGEGTRGSPLYRKETSERIMFNERNSQFVRYRLRASLLYEKELAVESILNK